MKTNMYAVIKTHAEMDAWGWHTRPDMFGLFDSLEEAKKAIKEDVEKETEDWEDEYKPKVRFSHFKWDEEYDTKKDFGFRYNDGDDDEENECDPENEWIYSIREMK